MEQSLPGRSVAYMVSDVRPQVAGIIQKRLFTEGQEVKAGDVLYQIDPRSYQASYDSAQGELAQAEAAVLSARPKAERYRALVAADAVSKQDGDDAIATLRQDEAAVVAAKASLQSAKINLDYTRVTAPISGRIGTSTYTPGALVTASQDTALTTIQQLDPIYVDLTQTSAQLLALRKQLDSGALKAVDGKAEVKIVLEDGSTYTRTGTLEFVGTSVDTGTGNVSLRAVVPNPDRLLLPGSYVRALLPMAINDSAILVPQGAVTRNTKGEATVKLVGDDGKVVERVVQVGDAIKDQWVVTSGLKAGEKLIVDGGSKVSAGQAVKVGQVGTSQAKDAAAARTGVAGAKAE
jgi:multidrug efflux system membrane fusion protein